MLRIIQLPLIHNRTDLDRILLGRDAVLATNREIPTERFHELVYSERGIVVMFYPKVTKIDDKGFAAKDAQGEPIIENGNAFVGHFRHGMVSPISFEGKVVIDAPALIKTDRSD